MKHKLSKIRRRKARPASEIIVGDCRNVLADMKPGSVQCVVTSPPYHGLRDYGIEGQLGSESTLKEYLATMVHVFRGVRRVLRNDGTLWLVLGDSYVKKQLQGMPWRLALALQKDGWWLRSDIVWHKPNPMTESGKCSLANINKKGQPVNLDRPTKSHEYVFLLTKRPTYYWDAEGVKEKGSGRCPGNRKYKYTGLPGHETKQGILAQANIPQMTRNIRDVWTVSTSNYPGAHFAVFPEKLVEPCILAGTSEKGCCPECGAPWNRVVSKSRRATRPALNNKQDETGRANQDPGRHITETTTIGWKPGCECRISISGQAHLPLTPIPCTVLDPFAGSGTVGVVCARENRAFVGIELNPEYAERARERIAGIFK